MSTLTTLDPWAAPCSACGYRHFGTDHPGVTIPRPGEPAPYVPGAGLGYDLRTDAPRRSREQVLAGMLGCDVSEVPPRPKNDWPRRGSTAWGFVTFLAVCMCALAAVALAAELERRRDVPAFVSAED